MVDEVSLKFVRQDDPSLRKRWFQGETMDLAVWQTSDLTIRRFQLILDEVRVVEWDHREGLRTGRQTVDRGPGGSRMTGGLNPDECVDFILLDRACQEFASHQPEAEKRVLKFVAKALAAAVNDCPEEDWPSPTLSQDHDSAIIDILTPDEGDSSKETAPPSRLQLMLSLLRLGSRD